MIFTVDDFGISQKANDLIFVAFEKKVITHASIMVNMPGSVGALRSTKKFKAVKFGLHLNLTKPIAPVLSIEREIRRQIEKLLEFVKKVDFINSHHNIHFLPMVLPVVVKLAKEYKIAKIRLPKQLVGPGIKPSLIQLVNLFNVIDNDFRLSDSWLDLDWYRQSSLMGFTSNLPQNTEISCHPLAFQKHRKQSTLEWLIENKNKLS